MRGSRPRTSPVISGQLCSPTVRLTLGNLRRGISMFRARWPQETDFHAAFYARLRTSLASGVTETAWRGLVNDLAAWKALRPLSKDEVYRRGLALAPRLEAERRRLVGTRPACSLSIGDADWAKAATLFTVAIEVKGVRSPVFPSKLCHFLAPDL